MSWIVEDRRGLHLPQVDLWCDVRFPAPRAFVSHAHFDHLGRHEQTYCSSGTARLMQARLGGEREVITLEYGHPHALDAGTEMRLYPAGHIHGSAMLWLEREGERLLYTGDFKLREGRSAEPAATPPADVVIMETTYGLPHYAFPPTEEVLAGIVRFCRETLEADEVPVLFGYSLGKSQEILAGLAEARLPVMLHKQVAAMTAVYESLGIVFPAYRDFGLKDVHGHVVIAPPQSSQSAWLRKIRKRRTAAITGWAMEPGARFRYQCDALFPLSDHADYPDLLAFVEKTGAKRVYTVHGYAREFAADLRESGIEAWALGSENQLELRVGTRARAAFPACPPSGAPEVSPSPPESFLAFAQTAESIRHATGKLQKVDLLRAYFQALPSELTGTAAIYFTGRAFAQSESRTLQTGWAILKRALLAVSGMREADFRATYRKYSDSGETAESLLTGRTHPPDKPWPLADTPDWFARLAELRGPHLKAAHLEERLAASHPLEAKYLFKIITGDLRIGLKEGLVEEALAVHLGIETKELREANMLTCDLGAVARAAADGTLSQLGIRVFRPVQFMLASPEADAEGIVKRIAPDGAADIWTEEKYDGIRCQVHKDGARVALYSRELRDITSQFPDLARAIEAVPADFIGDGELLAWDGGKALPFAELQKRLGRKIGAVGDLFLGEEIPVSLWLYDLLWEAGDSLLKHPLRERRARLDRLPESERLRVAPVTVCRNVSEIDAAFLAARKRGNEGLMAKEPASLYAPGRRGHQWLKLKKAYATLDVVVVGVEWGHGKRRGVLSDYTFAIRDERTGELRTIGKAYSGLTDAEIATYTEYFLQHTVEEKGRYRLVEPEVILEVAFDSIQPSKRHQSGYALRFPRIKRIREDKKLTEIDTLAHCQTLAGAPPAHG